MKGNLRKMAERAITDYNLANGFYGCDEISLENVYEVKTIDGRVVEAYAITKDSIVCWDRETIPFERLTDAAAESLMNILHAEFDIDF